jgi:hypothetical protein
MPFCFVVEEQVVTVVFESGGLVVKIGEKDFIDNSPSVSVPSKSNAIFRR